MLMRLPSKPWIAPQSLLSSYLLSLSLQPTPNHPSPTVPIFFHPQPSNFPHYPYPLPPHPHTTNYFSEEKWVYKLDKKMLEIKTEEFKSSNLASKRIRFQYHLWKSESSNVLLGDDVIVTLLSTSFV
jgi:hypothetical protein